MSLRLINDIVFVVLLIAGFSILLYVVFSLLGMQSNQENKKQILIKLQGFLRFSLMLISVTVVTAVYWALLVEISIPISEIFERMDLIVIGTLFFTVYYALGAILNFPLFPSRWYVKLFWWVQAYFVLLCVLNRQIYARDSFFYFLAILQSIYFLFWYWLYRNQRKLILNTSVKAH